MNNYFNVKQIAELMRQAKENKKPFVFFTGAGCSISAEVPSASKLIEEIQNKFKVQVSMIDHDKHKGDYGKYMAALDKDERRNLLKPHILDNHRINWAHIVLATLMQQGYIQRVLTFNFDSILNRACSLLDFYPSIYDFATSSPNLHYLMNDPSIVHLHGQGSGFVQLNTAQETNEHAGKLGDFIAHTLNNHPSLFIGYSGSSDQFFKTLQNKFTEQHRLIWTGRKKTLEELDVPEVKDFLTQNKNLAHYVPIQDADEFLIALAKELDCFPPLLFTNPYQFLGSQLEKLTEYPLNDGLDILKPLKDQLSDKAKDPELIDNFYCAFVHKYKNKEVFAELTEKQKDEVLWAYDRHAQTFYKNDNDEKSLKQVCEIYAQALNLSDQHLGILNNYGSCLSGLAQINQDKPMFQKSFEMFDKALKIQPEYINALNNYGNALSSYSYISENKDHVLQQAFHYITQAVSLEPHDTYDLACYYALINDCAKCQENLLIAQKHNTLPTKKHLEKDKDLNNVRSEPWFIELLDSL